MRTLFLSIILIAAVGSILPSCSILEAIEDDSDKYENWTAEKFYTEAKAALDSKNYDKTIRLLETLETRYPFGTYATQAQLDIAYAYYKYQEPESAIAAADRFIKIHPRNPHVDYAYYLKGLVNYNRGIGLLDRFLPTDSSQRDPGATLDAYVDFERLIRKFPDSRYTQDARQRMIALRNNLAMYEIHVARYYMKRKAYVAAVKRAVFVIEKFHRTPAMPLALEIMKKAYGKLGMDDLADDAGRVYAINFKDDTNLPSTLPQQQRSLTRKIWDFIGLDR